MIAVELSRRSAGVHASIATLLLNTYGLHRGIRDSGTTRLREVFFRGWVVSLNGRETGRSGGSADLISKYPKMLHSARKTQ
jgi:hypothetical protein